MLWRTSDAPDEYVFDSQRRWLRTWTTRAELDAFAMKERFQIKEETHRLSFDLLKNFVDAKTGLDLESALNFWTFFIDLEAGSDSHAFAQIDKVSLDLYGKTLSMTSPGLLVGIQPTPLTIAETGELREVMRVGLAVLERVLGP